MRILLLVLISIVVVGIIFVVFITTNEKNTTKIWIAKPTIECGDFWDKQNKTIPDFYASYGVKVFDLKFAKLDYRNPDRDQICANNTNSLECILASTNSIVTLPACGQSTDIHVFLLISESDVKTMREQFGYKVSVHNKTDINITELE